MYFHRLRTAHILVVIAIIYLQKPQAPSKAYFDDAALYNPFGRNKVSLSLPIKKKFDIIRTS